MIADQPPGRRPRSLLVLRTQAMAQDANANGDIFGGWIFAQMDKASGLFAAVVSAGRAVTATVDKVVFEHPVHIGDAVTV